MAIRSRYSSLRVRPGQRFDRQARSGTNNRDRSTDECQQDRNPWPFMGAYVVTEALRDLALQSRSSTLRRLGGVVLAAPDIDVDVFLSQLDDIGEIPQPFTIIVSNRDRALAFSRRLAGGKPRVGSGADISALQKRDIAVIDVSQIDGGRHGVFASSPTLMDVVNNDALLRNVLREPASTRQTALAESAMVAEGAASVVVFLPGRLLRGIAQAGGTR